VTENGGRVHRFTPNPKARPRSLDQSQTPFARSDLATALAAQADVIITGDKDLLTLKTHGGVRIRTPRQFMDAPKA
jgi:predicted nucleic acid-binding protein